MVTTLRPSTLAVESVNRSPPNLELSKPLPAIFSPLAAMTWPSLYRSRLAYTTHWPVNSSNAGSSASSMYHSSTCG